MMVCLQRAGAKITMKIRKLLMAIVLGGLAVGGFLTGRATAQQATPHEHTAFHSLPKLWGTFVTAVPTANGYVYFFESTDGVRNVRVGPGGIDDIELIRRR
jgi:hypothetical protein